MLQNYLVVFAYEAQIIEYAGSSKQHLQWTIKWVKTDIDSSWGGSPNQLAFSPFRSMQLAKQFFVRLLFSEVFIVTGRKEGK